MLTIAALLVLTQAVLVAGGNRGTVAPAIDAESAKLRLNPNIASASELQLLPRVGPKLAQNIIDYRESVATTPAFRALADLQNVPRIGPITAERLRPFLSFPSEEHDEPVLGAG